MSNYHKSIYGYLLWNTKQRESNRTFVKKFTIMIIKFI
jgi:hypothetical protein